MSDKNSIVIIGAGSRGLGYAENIKQYGEPNQVVGVVDPNPARVCRVQGLFPNIKPDMVFTDWYDFVARGKCADAVVIATQDKLHKAPAVACADLGYHILLEKPMATSIRDCQLIVQAVKRNKIIFAVCHVLRYTNFYQKLREATRAIGDIITIQHFEHVGFWHAAHSYVRGNWRNTKESSFMLLAKSCHDIDILRFLVGRPCRKVNSFGGLLHFKKENKPREAGLARRCLDCRFEKACPYSALKIYVRDRYDQGCRRWPLSILVDDITRENIMEALRTGPYGRCVYECDNDVVDHQVVNLEYEGGITASFTMSAFNTGSRQTIIQGARGMIRADMFEKKIEITDFLSGATRTETVNPLVDVVHGGGDDGLVIEWLRALKTGDHTKISTGADESLETHFCTFKAEESRLKGTVESV